MAVVKRISGRGRMRVRLEFESHREEYGQEDRAE